MPTFEELRTRKDSLRNAEMDALKLKIEALEKAEENRNSEKHLDSIKLAAKKESYDLSRRRANERWGWGITKAAGVAGALKAAIEYGKHLEKGSTKAPVVGPFLGAFAGATGLVTPSQGEINYTRGFVDPNYIPGVTDAKKVYFKEGGRFIPKAEGGVSIGDVITQLHNGVTDENGNTVVDPMSYRKAIREVRRNNNDVSRHDARSLRRHFRQQRAKDILSMDASPATDTTPADAPSFDFNSIANAKYDRNTGKVLYFDNLGLDITSNVPLLNGDNAEHARALEMALLAKSTAWDEDVQNAYTDIFGYNDDGSKINYRQQISESGTKPGYLTAYDGYIAALLLKIGADHDGKWGNLSMTKLNEYLQSEKHSDAEKEAVLRAYHNLKSGHMQIYNNRSFKGLRYANPVEEPKEDDYKYSYKQGGKMNKYQQGGAAPAQGELDMQTQIIQLVQAAMSGDEQATQTINKIMEAAKAGDQQALQIAQLIQQVAQLMQSQQAQAAKRGAKLSYIHSLVSGCPAGTEAKYYREGGHICKACIEKAKKVQLGAKAPQEPMKNKNKKYFSKKSEMQACGGKAKKHENGGNLERLRTFFNK